MKTALLAAAVDPSLGGVLIRGEKGTAKSTVVRALRELLPPLRAVTGCPYHCDPDRPAGLCDHCRTENRPEAVTVTVPLIELPLGATEDRLVGTLDIEHALTAGVRRFEPGLLAEANRGILYVDEVNLLEDHLVDLLLDAATSGENVVEREGISLRHPARFILVGTMNPEEGELRPQFLDRFGLCVTVRGLTETDERVEVIRRRTSFEADPGRFLRQWQQEDLRLRELVVAARKRISRLDASTQLLNDAVRIASEAGVAGHRADLALVKAARAFAALLERETIDRELLFEAARFVLPHRFDGRLLRSPEEADAEIDALLERLRSDDGLRKDAPAAGSADRRTAADADEVDEEALESMQIPGGAAAGSILLPILKKKSSPMTTRRKSGAR
ncbi:MAG: hypothetical protein EA384_08725 [Spirochaetaceae bacterium]|nr:MAG: hypothetical protein EA384_08725 [Spirochaetaceae bacterium]